MTPTCSHVRCPIAIIAALTEHCSQRQKSKVERLRAKVEPLLTQVTVETCDGSSASSRIPATRGGDTSSGSHLRRVDSCITPLKAQTPSRTCCESIAAEKEDMCGDERGPLPFSLLLALSLSLSRSVSLRLSPSQTCNGSSASNRIPATRGGDTSSARVLLPLV